MVGGAGGGEPLEGFEEAAGLGRGMSRPVLVRWWRDSDPVVSDAAQRCSGALVLGRFAATYAQLGAPRVRISAYRLASGSVDGAREPRDTSV